MAYRFDNNNWMAVYRSDIFGDFTTTVRQVNDGVWIYEIGCGKHVTVETPSGEKIAFPLQGAVGTREDAMASVRKLWALDADFYPTEIHDGLNRITLKCGYRPLPESAMITIGPARVKVSQTGERLFWSIHTLEKWDD